MYDSKTFESQLCRKLLAMTPTSSSFPNIELVDFVICLFQLNSNTIINIWLGGWEKEMEKVTSAGHKAILSACWYLNYINYGMDWPMVCYFYYLNRPLAMGWHGVANATPGQQNAIFLPPLRIF